LPPHKGKELNDWEPRRQELFKSTKYGDDVDRPIKKFDGTWTYFAPDIAYHYDKLQRGFDEIIDIFGADHSGYVSRMRAVISAFSDNQKELKVKLCQLVKLYKNNKPFKMSKRSGSFVTLSDLLNEVGPEVVRYTLLMRKNDAPIDFDFEKVLEQSKDNPVFYVQYAHARTVSIFKYASENGFEVNDGILAISDFGLLSSDLERLVVRKLGEWPNVLRQAAANHEPHRLAFYLYDLASTFHSLQHRGKLDGNLRFVIKEAERLSFSRLALVRSLQIVIQSGLQILGIEPRHEME
jgi:arginyl-tRNA synthetase